MKRGIHNLFARANLCRGDLVIGAITALGGGFNGWKVLVIAVAVAKEEDLSDPRALPKPD